MSEDAQQPELVRLYSFAVAVAGVKRFHAARAAAIAGGFPAKTAAFLAAVLDGPHAENSIFLKDPCEQLKALATAAEGLYLVAICNKQGDYTLATSSSSAGSIQDGSSTETVDPAAAVASAVAAGATLEALDRSMEGLAILQDSCAGAVLGKALEKLWKLLQDREGFVYTVPAALAKHKAAAEASAAEAATAESNGDSSSKAETGGNPAQEDGESAESAQEETEEQKKLRAAAEEAIAMSDMTFDENWHMYLKAVYDTQLVPIYAAVGMQLVAALLQLLVHKEVRSSCRFAHACRPPRWLWCCCFCARMHSVTLLLLRPHAMRSVMLLLLARMLCTLWCGCFRHVHSPQEWHCLPEFEPTAKDCC